jgi:hypothetical protein
MPSLNDVLVENGNDLSNHDLAVLADWAGRMKYSVSNPEWKRAYSLLREGADLLLRRRARSSVAAVESEPSNDEQPTSTPTIPATDDAGVIFCKPKRLP